MSNGSEFQFPVDLTSIMLFASALGERNKIYYDADYGATTPLGGVIAPPTFATASQHWDPHHSLRGVRQIPEAAPRETKRDAASSGQGGGSGGGLARVLHGEQRFTWHQPMRPGMKLTVTTHPGKSWSKEGKRGGTMQFRESVTEYRDENGEPVCTAVSVGITTSKAVES